MSTIPRDNGVDQDGVRDSKPEIQSEGSRRALLGAAAGGFALAASGLLLPDWLVEEAAADKHPVRRIQGRNERKRQKRHHQDKQRHDKERRQDEKDANDDTPRSGFPFDIFVGVRFAKDQTVWPKEELRVDFNTYNDPGFGKKKSWDSQEHVYLHPQETTSYKFDVSKVQVAVEAYVLRFVEIENYAIGTPTVRVYDKDHSYEVGYTFDVDQEHVYLGARPGNWGDDPIFKVRRNQDTPGYKNFVIDVIADGYRVQ